MRSTEENIEALTRAVLSEAREEANQILVDAKENADAITKRGQELANEERTKIMDHANQSAERIRGQSIATTQLKARNLFLESREKQLDKVFASARDQISKIQQRADYDQISRRLLRESLVQIKASKVVIRADETTMKFLTGSVLDDISKELNVQVKIGRPLEKGIGVIVDTEDGHMHFDNTIESRLNQLQNNLRSPVYHLLMGEQL